MKLLNKKGLEENTEEYQLLEIKDKVSRLEKGELHVHLNGLVSTSLIRDILALEGANTGGFDLLNDLNHLKPVASLAEYLVPWSMLRLIPSSRAHLHEMIDDAFRNLDAANVKFAELRNTVFYLAALNGISDTEAMNWLVEELRVSSEKYGINAGWIFTVNRGPCSRDDLQRLTDAIQEIGCPKEILAVDLAGNEEIPIDDRIAELFRYCKEQLGLGVTIHAGETGSVKNMYQAINDFHADRIGHGTAAWKDQGLMKLLREKDICLEICPVSNLLSNAVPVGERHPFNQFIAHEVPFVICSDNPAIHAKTINEDYLSFYIEQRNMELLEHMYSLQTKYSFL